MPAFQARVHDLLCCPKCGREAGADQCRGCGHAIPARDGIRDYTLGGVTALDEIDYDTVYDVDPRKGLPYFRHLRTELAGMLDGRLGTVVELGAGTGYMSVPLAAELDYERFIVTDISHKMLALCQRKIAAQVSAERCRRIGFATIDGNHFHVRPETTRLVFGHGILHHVFDYEPLLAAIRRMTRRDGFAVFVEPGYKFHVALLHILGRVVAQFQSGRDYGDDTERILSLYQHLAASWKFRKDRAFVAGLEDKHMFVHEEMRASARAAGFARLVILPAYRGETFVGKMRGYAGELGLAPESTRRLLEFVAREQLMLEDILDRECWSSADIHVFCRSESDALRLDAKARLGAPDTRRELAQLIGAEARRVECWIDAIEPLASGGYRLNGWVTANVPVRHVGAEGIGGKVATGYVYQSRADVLRHLAARDDIDTLSATCCGFSLNGARLLRPGRVELEVHFVDGVVTRIEAALPAPTAPQGLASSITTG